MMRAVPGKPDPENPRKRVSRDPEAEKMLDQLAQDFKAEDYSSSLLAVLGDHLMKKGIKEKAVTFYNRLIQFFPNSDYQDFGYVGLADIALAENDLETAEKYYKVAIEKLAGIKYPNALLGLSKTQIARKIYTECSKYLDEIINVKDWKGPLHCEAFFLRAEVNRLMGNYANAVNDYGRLFLSFAKYEDWAVKGYLGAEECHRAMGSPTQAANALKEAKEYLLKRKLETSALMEMVRKRALERGVPLN
jgi:tetratricopeptide (TPR) repeat protein